MNLQKTIPLSSIYNREEDFSADLADNLDAIRVGKFEGVKTEASVGTRRADIVAVGEDGTLVVENQFGKADWDHWGRLEAYARLKEANVAVLVAEDFEELMKVTCNLRNEDSTIDWYLIQAQANSHKELFFHHVARPAIDIQIERQLDAEYSEFWAPIRDGEYGEIFAGKPEPINKKHLMNEGWMGKSIRDDIHLWFKLNKRNCYIELYFYGANPSKSRDEVMALFSQSDYGCKNTDTSTDTRVKFPVLNKGKNDRDDWDEIREKLVARGTTIYNKINESNL